MNGIDLEKLLSPVSDENPAGEDLSELTEYYVLEELVAGREETQFSEAEPPEWPEVLKAAEKLLGLGKELWVVRHTLHALVATVGTDGLSAGTALISAMLRRYWDSLYPELEPSEENPAEQRMNILADLAAPAGPFAALLKELPLCNSRQLGSYSYRQILQARGESSSEGAPVVQLAAITGAIRDTPPETLEETCRNLARSARTLHRLDAFLSLRVGMHNNTARLPMLTELLKGMMAVLIPPGETAPHGIAAADTFWKMADDASNSGEDDPHLLLQTERPPGGNLSHRDATGTIPAGEMTSGHGNPLKKASGDPSPRHEDLEDTATGNPFSEPGSLEGTATGAALAGHGHLGPGDAGNLFSSRKGSAASPSDHAGDLSGISPGSGGHAPGGWAEGPPPEPMYLSAGGPGYSRGEACPDAAPGFPGPDGISAIGCQGDVIAVLDRIAAWYRRNEPSSPVPLIVGRARELVGKGFREIIRIIADRAESQVTAILGEEEAAESPSQATAPSAEADGFTWPIRSQEEVVLSLEKLYDWYLLFEPSSPVPLYLERARKLVGKGFAEIIEDMADQASEQVKGLVGEHEPS